MKLPQFTCDIPLEVELLEAFACVLSYPASNTCLLAHEPVGEDSDGNIIVAGQTPEFTKQLIDMVADRRKPCVDFWSYEFDAKIIEKFCSYVKESNLGMVCVEHCVKNKTYTQYIVCAHEEKFQTSDLLKWANEQTFWVKHIMFGLIYGYDVYEIRKHLLLLERMARFQKFGKAPINSTWFAE